MRSLLVLPLALVLAACGASGSVGQARTAATEPLLVLGGTAPVGVGPAVMTYPLDGAFAYAPDSRCAGIGSTLPSLTTAVCWRAKAMDYLVQEVAAKRVLPGPAFTVCNWAYSDPVSWRGCVDYQIRQATPEIRWGQSALWLTGSVQGEPVTGCAAGVAYREYIRVSLWEPARVMSLVAWETSNSILAYTLDRYTAADGPITSAATNAARAACPAN